VAGMRSMMSVTRSPYLHRPGVATGRFRAFRGGCGACAVCLFPGSLPGLASGWVGQGSRQRSRSDAGRRP
jgi:hypothetical protein